MLRVSILCARHKSLPASYANAYEGACNFLRPEYGIIKVSVQRT